MTIMALSLMEQSWKKSRFQTKSMCESCYVGDKLSGLLDTSKPPCISIEVMGSHIGAAEIGLNRRLER